MPPQSDDDILLRLRTDPRYFIERCLFIVDKNSNKVPFLWRPHFIKWWANHSNDDFILKARKMGFSAGITAIWLHACIFQQNTRAVIISHEDKATVRLLERVRYYIDTCLVPIRTKKNSESEISFPDTNSTLWIGTAGQRAFGRGDDITHLHASEVCHYQNYSIMTGVKEAMRNNSIVVRESTANGAGTPTHKLWTDSVAGINSIRPHFFGWQDDPEYCSPDNTPFELTDEEKDLKRALDLTWAQLRWRRDKIKSMDEPEKFPQEYPASYEEAFLTSGQLVFKWQDLKRQEAGVLPIKWHGDLTNTGGQVVVNPNPRGAFRTWRTPRMQQ
jgi:hypothetical protein